MGQFLENFGHFLFLTSGHTWGNVLSRIALGKINRNLQGLRFELSVDLVMTIDNSLQNSFFQKCDLSPFLRVKGNMDRALASTTFAYLQCP